DKAILSFRPCPAWQQTPTRCSTGLPGTGPRGDRRGTADPLHLTWCADWPASHKYRWRTTMPERPLECAGLRRENRRPVYRCPCDDNHKTITLLVTNTDQAVIATAYPPRSFRSFRSGGAAQGSTGLGAA